VTPRLFGIAMGWVPMAAGPVWMVRTLIMAFAAATASHSASPHASLHGGLVIGFILLCWMHPVLTNVAEGAGAEVA